MQSANAKKFRSELKDYMDAACSEPVRMKFNLYKEDFSR